MPANELRLLLLAPIMLPVLFACRPGGERGPTEPPPSWSVSVAVGGDVTIVAERRHTQNSVFEDPGTSEPPWNYSIDWGDGSARATGVVTEQGTLPQRSHTYDSPGVYTLSVTVTDKHRATGTGRRTVTVAPNQPPVVAINGPYASTEGSIISFSSDGSADPNQDELSYRWTFGDGTTSTAASPAHAYADNGTYSVTLRVTDPSGATGTAATTANVTNVPPGRQLLAPTAIFEGSDYTITLSGSDAGAKDRASLEYALDCGLGDGYSAWSAIVRSVTCAVQLDQRADSIRVRGKVRDKDGAETEYTHHIQVRNAAPRVTFAATTATTVKAGESVTFQAAFTDAGINDAPWTWRVVWGDNTPSAKGVSAVQGDLGPSMHTYAKPGLYTAYVNVQDKDGSDQSSRRIAITVTP